MRASPAVLLFALLPLACSAVLGIHDITPPADGGGVEAGREAGLQDAPSPTDAATEVPPSDASGEACAADLQGDPLNCGHCLHSCQGAGCSGGMCTPSPLVQGSPHDPVSIIVDAKNLYFAAANYVSYCPLAGCGEVSMELTHIANSSIATITSLAVSSSDLFFTGVIANGPDGGMSASVYEKPISTTAGLPNNITSTPLTPGALVACGTTNLCWVASDPSSSAVFTSPATCPPSGCPAGPMSLFKNSVLFVPTLAWDGTLVYFTDRSNIYSVDVSNPQPPATVAMRTGVQQIVWRSGHLFWIEYGGGAGEVMQCTLPDCSTSIVPLAGPGIPSLGELAVDDQAVYWTIDRDPGEIDSCTIGGCGGQPRIVATQQSNPHALAVDGTRVYWATATGVTYDIMWVAK